MNAMAPPRPIVLHRHRVPLTAGPAAAGEARGQVRAAICTWDVPVDVDAAILLTSELVTNAIAHETGETVMLAVTCFGSELRVDVHDTSVALPMPADAPVDAETGRGLMLVDSLASEWGCYRTPSGKAVYFTLAFESDLDAGNGRGPQRRSDERGPQGRSAERGLRKRSHVGPVRRNPSAVHRAH